MYWQRRKKWHQSQREERMSRFFSVRWNYSVISSQISGRNTIDFLLQLQDWFKNLIKGLRSVINFSPHQWPPSNHQCRRLSGDDHNRRLTHLIQGHSKRLWPDYGTTLATILHCFVLALVHEKQNTEQELSSFKYHGKYPDNDKRGRNIQDPWLCDREPSATPPLDARTDIPIQKFNWG